MKLLICRNGRYWKKISIFDIDKIGNRNAYRRSIMYGCDKYRNSAWLLTVTFWTEIRYTIRIFEGKAVGIIKTNSYYNKLSTAYPEKISSSRITNYKIMIYRNALVWSDIYLPLQCVLLLKIMIVRMQLIERSHSHWHFVHSHRLIFRANSSYIWNQMTL